MEMEKVRLMMVFAGAAVYMLVLASIPLRLKLIMRKAGNLVVPIAKKNIVMQIGIMILSGCLIGILAVRELGLFVDAVILLVGIIGVVMGSQDAFLSGKGGLYENGIIGNGCFVSISEINALPALSYTKEEREALNQTVLMVSTENRGIINFLFDTEEEKKNIENELLKLKPGLKR